MSLDKAQLVALVEKQKVRLDAFLSFKGKLERFAEFLKTARGQTDINYRLKPILDPDNLLTTSRLSGEQQLFVSGAFFVASNFQGFKGIKQYAELVMATSISEKGKGRDEAIQFEQAINEKRMMKLGFISKDGKDK